MAMKDKDMHEHPEQSVILAESGGGLCVPYEERAFSDAIVEIISDPRRADAMGKRGKHYATQHRSYELLASRLDQTYRNLCGKSGMH